MNTPTRTDPILRNYPVHHSNNGTKQTQYATHNQHDGPMLSIMGQNSRNRPSNDVIRGTLNRPILSTPQDARVAQFAPLERRQRMNQSASAQFNNESASPSRV